jgi:type 1 fimbriae regulatory protein FimB
MFFRRVFWFFQRKQSVYDFSNNELLAILAEAKSHSERDWLMMCVAYNHGLRVSELTGKKAFRGKDVADGRLYIKREKRGELCIHPLVENPNPLLNERLLLLAYAAKTKPGEPVFKIGRQWFWVLVKRYAKAAGIPARQARTHSFRHTVAMNLVDKIGVPKLQRFLGQRSDGAVLRYTKPKEKDATDAANRVLSGR